MWFLFSEEIIASFKKLLQWTQTYPQILRIMTSQLDCNMEPEVTSLNYNRTESSIMISLNLNSNDDTE
jgi:hypothetical protein